MSKKKKFNKNRPSNSNANTQAKKEAVLGSTKSSKTPMMVGIAVAILIVAGGFYFLQIHNAKPAYTAKQFTPSSPSDVVPQITYPVAMFDDGNARHFEYAHGSLKIKYFILKSSDGVIRAAFDACDVCWPAGKGYYQEGDHMVCRNCGRRFASIKVNEVKGGCNPAPLLRATEGDKVIIKVNDLLDGKNYFDFSKKA
jgi:uncharacterized membrane protein